MAPEPGGGGVKWKNEGESAIKAVFSYLMRSPERAILSLYEDKCALTL